MSIEIDPKHSFLKPGPQAIPETFICPQAIVWPHFLKTTQRNKSRACVHYNFWMHLKQVPWQKEIPGRKDEGLHGPVCSIAWLPQLETQGGRWVMGVDKSLAVPTRPPAFFWIYPVPSLKWAVTFIAWLYCFTLPCWGTRSQGFVKIVEEMKEELLQCGYSGPLVQF